MKKPKRSKKAQPLDGTWVDIDELVKPGEIKEIWPGIYVNNTGVILDPPEPIKKPRRTKPKKKSA